VISAQHTVKRWRPRHARARVVALFGLLALGIPAVPGLLTPAHAATAPGRGDRAPRGAFRWLVPRAAPPDWPRLVTPTTTATLSYPPSFAPVTGDPGSVSAAVRSPAGLYLAYLNATPQQGAERPHGFAAFRVHLLGEDHDEAVHEEAAAEHVSFQGGRGSCVIDAYVTRMHHRHYREIACLVVGSHASTVVVAAALKSSWDQFRPLLQRSVAAFTVS
jgi:hypothetical protein